jgi:heme/copper-type cytochrome/quinol oxidase subunit 2
MQMNIIVDEPEQFETWLKKQKTVEETMIQATRVEEEKSNMLVEKKEL